MTKPMVDVESRLRSGADEVWVHATSMRGIDREITPFMRMTYPKEAEGLTLDGAGVVAGEPLFVSWILLGRVLPVERLTLVLTEIGPGHRFVEQSRMGVMRSWRHERWITRDGDGCTLHDRVTAEPPLAIARPVVGALLRRFFQHRHAYLRRVFG